MSKPLSKLAHRPVRKLLILSAVIGLLLALRNATADKGGSYDPATGRS